MGLFIMDNQELSIIVPAYQAEQWIFSTVETLINNFPQAEIIVVNDDSLDHSEEMQKKFGQRLVYLNNNGNYGKGYSLRQGFDRAQGKYLIFTDADLPFGIAGVNAIWQELKKDKNPVVIGSRDQFYNDKFYKRLLRPFLYVALWALFGFHYHDTQCGLKGFSRNVGKKLFSSSISHGFAIDIEILYLAEKLGYAIERIAVQQEIYSGQFSTFRFPNICRVFWDLFVIRTHKYEL